MSKLKDVSVVIEELATVQVQRWHAGHRDELAELLGQAYCLLKMRDDEATEAVAAIEDALTAVAWTEHNGSGDPPPTFPDYVQVRFRDGESRCGIRWDWDRNWWWSTEFHDGDILAYRALPTSSPSLSKDKIDGD